MELKSYQKTALRDLTRYLALLNECGDSVRAFRQFWQEQDVPVGGAGLQVYQDILKSVPHLCFKVPAGGGKTFLTCASLRPLFDAMPFLKAQAATCGWYPPTPFWNRRSKI